MLAALHVLPEGAAIEKHLDCYLFARKKTDDLGRHSFDSTLLLTELANLFFTEKSHGQEVTHKQ